jgi:hypothetical protein
MAKPGEPGGTRRALFDQYGQTLVTQVIGEAQHGFGHFRALIFADEGNCLERAGHGSIKPHYADGSHAAR